MAAEPSNYVEQSSKTELRATMNGSANVFSDSSSESSDSDEDSYETHGRSNESENRQLAIACDDGCVRLYLSSDSDTLTYKRTFPRVSGETLTDAILNGFLLSI